MLEEKYTCYQSYKHEPPKTSKSKYIALQFPCHVALYKEYWKIYE